MAFRTGGPRSTQLRTTTGQALDLGRRRGDNGRPALDHGTVSPSARAPGCHPTGRRRTFPTQRFHSQTEGASGITMKPTSLHLLRGLAAPWILMPALLSSAPCAAGSGPAPADNGEVPGLRIRV